MRRRCFTGDVWTDAKLLQAEELAAAARRVAARRALLRAARPPRRSVRAWLGAVLLAAGQRLLGSLAGLDQAAGGAPGHGDSGRTRAVCPVCHSPWRAASHRPRPG